MPKMTNPLRYPGGKSFLTGYIADVIQSYDLTGCTFYEPYAGSAAVSLEMLRRGLVNEIVLMERDPLVYAFWKTVVDQPERLCREIDQLDITLSTWHRLNPLRQARSPLEYPLLEMGLAALFYSRTNYSGILMANPIGGKAQKSRYTIDCRFNKESVKNQVRAIAKYRDRITVKWGDAVSFLQDNRKKLEKQRCFVYVDPPYYEKGKTLYRYYYTDKDHEALATVLKTCNFPWLLSYDNHQFIRNLYFSQGSSICVRILYLDYFAQTRKCGNELLISNLEIPPVKRLVRAALP